VAKTTKQDPRQRRARIEELRREQRRAERRKTMLLVGIATVVGLGIIAAAAVPIISDAINDPAKKPVSSFGVAAAAASCDAPTNDPTTGGGEHVGPGTQKPDQTTVKYATVPPSSGPHYAVPASGQRKFYGENDRPRMEELVHNLEHGYTVLWYDDTVKGDERTALEDLSKRIPRDPQNAKFVVSAWDPAYGAFPAGKHIALSHWSKDSGHRQLCGKVSGAAIASFMKAYPGTDAPEAGAA
jgi:Protein of unknown function (DUF3105)